MSSFPYQMTEFLNEWIGGGYMKGLHRHLNAGKVKELLELSRDNDFDDGTKGVPIYRGITVHGSVVNIVHAVMVENRKLKLEKRLVESWSTLPGHSRKFAKSFYRGVGVMLSKPEARRGSVIYNMANESLQGRVPSVLV